MIHVVSLAFFGACIAHFRARRTNHCREFASATHELRSRAAECRAVHVQRDAARHHLHIFFLQARARAVIAGHCTFVAGVDTGLHALVRHGEAPLTCGVES